MSLLKHWKRNSFRPSPRVGRYIHTHNQLYHTFKWGRCHFTCNFVKKFVTKELSMHLHAHRRMWHATQSTTTTPATTKTKVIQDTDTASVKEDIPILPLGVSQDVAYSSRCCRWMPSNRRLASVRPIWSTLGPPIPSLLMMEPAMAEALALPLSMLVVFDVGIQLVIWLRCSFLLAFATALAPCFLFQGSFFLCLTDLRWREIGIHWIIIFTHDINEKLFANEMARIRGVC